ncbi:MAG: glycoside hydrolase family 28 protein [Bacteroidota bacterium]
MNRFLAFGGICTAALLAMTFAGSLRAASPADGVIAYPRCPGDDVNKDYPSVTVNGMPVDTVMTGMNVGYAHFAFSGTATVEITAREAVGAFDLSPHRYGIKADKSGNKLTFTLSEPRKLHLKVNNLTRFFIFADGPEVNPPRPGQPGVYSLLGYGVISSPGEPQTAKVQKAIDDVAAKGGTLYVPAGIYRTGELRMKSNLTLYLAPGAMLKGVDTLAEFPAGELGTQYIHLLDCENVKIKGRGVIDANGKALRLANLGVSGARTKLVRAYRAKDCTVDDVILRNSGTWSVHLVNSSLLRFTNYKLISATIMDGKFPEEPNTDGFDPDDSSHILIENGFISTNDDAVAVKLHNGTHQDMDGIVFRGNVIWTCKSALKIGTEVNPGHKMTDIVFENNDIVHADRGIVVYCYRGATIEGPKWIGNYFEYIGDDGKQQNIVLEIKDDKQLGLGYVNNATIKDCTFEKFSPGISELTGGDGTHLIRGVTLENLMIAGQKRMSLSEAKIITNGYVADIVFK